MGYRRYEEVFINIDGKEIKLYNSYGFFAAEYVNYTGLPKNERRKNWLSKSQCKIIKKPVNEDELINGIVGFMPAMHGYYALYERFIDDGDVKLLKQKGKY